MRSLILLFAAAALAACASTTASTPEVSTPVAVTAPTPSAPAQSPLTAMLMNAGRPNAPDLATVERSLGAADIRRQDGAGTLLTYRLETCALMLVFSADAQNTMRLAEAHPAARRAGAPAPSLDQCAVEAGARHPS